MKTSATLFRWLPRMLCILAIVFISLFAADAFNSKLSFWKQLGGFFIHLIPSFILLAILILAWKNEFWGGILFIVAGGICAPVLFNSNFHVSQSVVKSLGVMIALVLPFIIVGILFIISHYKGKKNPT